MFKKFKGNAEKLSNTAKGKVGSAAQNIGEAISGDLKEKIKNTSSGLLEKTDPAAQGRIAKTVGGLRDHIESSASEISAKAGDYFDSNLENVESYCSWCFEKHFCTLKEKNNFSRNVYICSGCGREVVKCRGCDNKAKFVDSGVNENENVGFWSGNFCSVHDGTIAKFETLDWKLSSIGEYRDIIEREQINYKKIGTTAAFAIGGAAVIAPLALAAAPAVGGAIGTSLLGYSGAAATNAGLAALGGGALAAGGAGMAGGVAVVTAAGSALGGRYGAVISNSYYGDIDGFEIFKIKQGKGPIVICIDGFLTEKQKEAPGNWLAALSGKYVDNEVFYLKWESKRLHDIASSAGMLTGAGFAKKGLAGLAKSASKTAATKLAPIGMAYQALGIATNPWSVAGIKAYQTGALLADLIARTDEEYILIGHSLGARVIYSCLAALRTKGECYIDGVHLLGGAVNNNCSSNADCSGSVNWAGIHSAVSGRVCNYFSKNDAVLKYLYTVGEGVKFDHGKPIGRTEIGNPNISNIDVSSYVGGHSEYKKSVSSFLVS